jgi:hypothetical protein
MVVARISLETYKKKKKGTAMIGNILRAFMALNTIKKVAVATAVVYVGGAITSGTKAKLQGAGWGKAGVRALQSWYGVFKKNTRSTSSTSKRKKKRGNPGSHTHTSKMSLKKANTMKKALSTMLKNPTPGNVKKALATANRLGIKVPKAITEQVSKLSTTP